MNNGQSNHEEIDCQDQGAERPDADFFPECVLREFGWWKFMRPHELPPYARVKN